MSFKNLSRLVPLVVVATLAFGLPAVAQEDAPAQVLITNVSVWDGTSDAAQPAMDVLIEGNLIKEVGANLSAGSAKVIDGGGGTLMPGLIDMHSHLAIQEGMLTGRFDYDQMAMGARAGKDLLGYLDQGFTTARDAGGNVLGLAKAERNGLIDSPCHQRGDLCRHPREDRH